jgi:hypothetical protein
MTHEIDPLVRDLRRKEAAAYITARYFEVATRTLANLAVLGGGPRFRKVGSRTLYSRADCDAWAISKLGPLVSSTSELRQKAASSEPNHSHQNRVLAER